MFKKLLFLSLLIFGILSSLVFISPSISQAAGVTKFNSANPCVYSGGDTIHENTITGTTGQVLTLSCLPIMFVNLIYWLLIFAGVVALFLIIFGGFRFMTSGGDPKSVEGARNTIIWAIIGLVVVLLSFAIVGFISDVTGVRCITRFGFLGTCGAP